MPASRDSAMRSASPPLDDRKTPSTRLSKSTVSVDDFEEDEHGPSLDDARSALAAGRAVDIIRDTL